MVIVEKIKEKINVRQAGGGEGEREEARNWKAHGAEERGEQCPADDRTVMQNTRESERCRNPAESKESIQ
jgi:hypothetical protein